MASSAMELRLGCSSSCQLHTQKQTQTKWADDLLAHVLVLQALRLFMRVYFNAGDIRTWQTTIILITGQIWVPKLEPHASKAMASMSGTSHLHQLRTDCLLATPKIKATIVDNCCSKGKAVHYVMIVYIYVNARGYSDLVWTEVCRSNLETPTHFCGSFWQKKVPIFIDFSWI